MKLKKSVRIKLLDTRLKDIVDWGERFDFMTVDEQRAVINQLIERIEITRGYHIKITYTVNLEDFFGENPYGKMNSADLMVANF